METVETAFASVKVLNIAETIKGGIATYLSGLESGADTLACEFAHLVPLAQVDELKARRVFTHGGSRSPWGLLKLMRKTISVQREYRAQVVFAHSTFAGVVLCLTKPFLGAGVKTLYCPHGWAMFREMSWWKKRLVATVERAMSFVPSKVVNISAYEHAETASQGFSTRCALIPNAVADVEDFRLLDSGTSRPIRVLYVGRFDRQKGVDILLGALSRMGDSAVGRFEVDLVGDGVLDHGAEVLGHLPEHVKHHGWLDRTAIHKLYKAADILIMPSRWEGFGLCAIEAFRAGTPVLARRVGALPEIITDGVTGFLFDGGAEELASTLSGLELDRLRSMRLAARVAFEDRYRIDRLHGQYRDLLAGLMRSPVSCVTREGA